jgi:hypothetical protein
MIGAWGVATQSTGKTLQLRALDWSCRDFTHVITREAEIDPLALFPVDSGMFTDPSRTSLQWLCTILLATTADTHLSTLALLGGSHR